MTSRGTIHQAEFHVAQRQRAAKQAAPALIEPWFAERLRQTGLAEIGWAVGAGEERCLDVTAATPAHLLLASLLLPVDREQPLPAIGTTLQAKCWVERYAARGKIYLAAAAAGTAKGCHCCSEKKPAASGSTVAKLGGTNHLDGK